MISVFFFFFLSASNPEDTLGRTREEDLCNESYKISALVPLVLIQRRSRSDNRSDREMHSEYKSFIFAGVTRLGEKTAAIMEITGDESYR